MKNPLFVVCLLLWQIVLGQDTNLHLASPFDATLWVEQHFAKGKNPPFSFIYGGKRSVLFIKNWQFRSEKVDSQADKDEYLFTYSDPGSGLVVKCEVVCFKDFPAVEWLLKFANTSGKNTPVIEKAKVIDHRFISGEGAFTLHYSGGSKADRKDFDPRSKIMKAGENVYMSPTRGRSSDVDAFPFFNVEMPGNQGFVAAIGWSGKWFADVIRPDEKSIALQSGMDKMKMLLYPREEIRTPKICLLFWRGDDRMVGHNQFRRFILKHHSRQIDGRFAEYPLSGSFDFGDPSPCNEYECLTADYAIALVKRYQYFNILPEVFWLDAGWYTGCGLKEGGGWWRNVGNMTTDKERFPDGLRPVADAVHSVGAKFMVWFEPERVYAGSEIDHKHPEWLIKLPGVDNRLFDLGNLEARDWLIEYMTEFIEREGIDYYRQDFNMDPFPYWKIKDKPNRIGASEIKHIEGLYAYWDSLLVRFPNLLIDNCASGGRRLDLETTSRSAPLWRTDYQYGEVNGYQCHTYGLNFYLPIHGTGVYKTDPFQFRSSLSAAMTTNWEITGKNSETIPMIQRRIKEYKELRPYYYGDYYPLTTNQGYTSNSVWLAYQMNRPEYGDGIIVAFRREQNKNESIRIKLSGLNDQSSYELFYEDFGIREKRKGSELKEGLDIMIAESPGSLLIRYKEIK